MLISGSSLLLTEKSAETIHVPMAAGRNIKSDVLENSS